MEGGERMKMRMLGSKRRRTRGRTDVNGEMDTFTQSLAEVGPFFSLLSPLEQIREQSKPGHPMSNPPQPSGARLPALISVHSYGTYAFKHVSGCARYALISTMDVFFLSFFFFFSFAVDLLLSNLALSFCVFPTVHPRPCYMVHLSLLPLFINTTATPPRIPPRRALSEQRQPYLYLHPQPHPNRTRTVTRH